VVAVQTDLGEVRGSQPDRNALDTTVERDQVPTGGLGLVEVVLLRMDQTAAVIGGHAVGTANLHPLLEAAFCTPLAVAVVPSKGRAVLEVLGEAERAEGLMATGVAVQRIPVLGEAEQARHSSILVREELVVPALL